MLSSCPSSSSRLISSAFAWSPGSPFDTLLWFPRGVELDPVGADWAPGAGCATDVTVSTAGLYRLFFWGRSCAPKVEKPMAAAMAAASASAPGSIVCEELLWGG